MFSAEWPWIDAENSRGEWEVIRRSGQRLKADFRNLLKYWSPSSNHSPRVSSHPYSPPHPTPLPYPERATAGLGARWEPGCPFGGAGQPPAVSGQEWNHFLSSEDTICFLERRGGGGRKGVLDIKKPLFILHITAQWQFLSGNVSDHSRKGSIYFELSSICSLLCCLQCFFFFFF